ncbi:MAG TPA: hypothetical protein VMB25_05130 [Bryobacteraceae bacterium]|nr:hypothetical protein [Bryobacteraceae bacterium]
MTRSILLLLAATLLNAQTPLQNNGKPIQVPYECVSDELEAAGLSCNEDNPCQVYLELANLEAVGNKIFLTGDLHTSDTTLSSVLLASEDGGVTWTEPAARMRYSGLDQIQFIDPQNGWISGANLQSAPRDPFLLITTDGGKTWRERPLFEESRVAAIEKFWFDSPENGSLLVDATLDNGKHELYETKTGGESWAIELASASPIKFAHGRTGERVWRLQPDAATHSYAIEKTEGGGRWHKAASFLVSIASCKP